MHITDSTDDTIVALATGASPAGVAVIRFSGPQSLKVVRQMVRLPNPIPSRSALFRKVRHPETKAVLDEAVVIYFQGPASFTGEDIVEIQCHGGLTQTASILAAAHSAGARAAEPGEFSRRAFLHGRMTLEQAEAVADMVSAETDAALNAARSQLFGALGERIREFSSELLDLRAEAEALLDFPEDMALLEVPVSDFAARAAEVADKCKELRATHRAGRALREGARVVLAGAPNAGKSSLLNALAGEARALTDDVPGTTRDSIDVRLEIDGIPCTLVDTAGIRTEGADRVEVRGMQRAKDEMDRATLTLWILDSASPVMPDREISGQMMLVANKWDLVEKLPDGIRADLCVSARTGQNLNELRSAIARRISGDGSGSTEQILVTNRRHAELLESAESFLRDAVVNATQAPLEIFAYDLRNALDCLDRIVGKAVDDALLDQVFSKFCIGK